MSVTFTLYDERDLQELPALVKPMKFPLKFTVRQMRERNANRFKRMNALIRDICRHKYGRMTITEREHNREVNLWKQTSCWPRYDDPEPSPDTGEVLYLPKSREDLDDDQIKGICQWLDHYIDLKGIPRHDPQTRQRMGEAA